MMMSVKYSMTEEMVFDTRVYASCKIIREGRGSR